MALQTVFSVQPIGITSQIFCGDDVTGCVAADQRVHAVRAAEVGLHAGRQDTACRRGARDRSPRRAARADSRQTHL